MFVLLVFVLVLLVLCIFASVLLISQQVDFIYRHISLLTYLLVII